VPGGDEKENQDGDLGEKEKIWGEKNPTEGARNRGTLNWLGRGKKCVDTENSDTWTRWNLKRLEEGRGCPQDPVVFEYYSITR